MKYDRKSCLQDMTYHNSLKKKLKYFSFWAIQQSVNFLIKVHEQLFRYIYTYKGYNGKSLIKECV